MYCKQGKVESHTLYHIHKIETKYFRDRVFDEREILTCHIIVVTTEKKIKRSNLTHFLTF